MKKYTRHIFSLILAAVMMFGMAISGFAAGGHVTYTSNGEKFEFAPGSEYSDTDLFAEMKEMMPGDKLSQPVVFLYNGKDGTTANVYLKAVMPTANEVKKGDSDNGDGYTDKTVDHDMLKYLKMKVTDAQGNVIFNGRLGDLNDNEKRSTELDEFVKIASLRKGKETRLEVEVELDIETANDFRHSAAGVDWIFKIEEIPDPSQSPDTGDNTGVLLYGGMFGIAALALLVIIVLKKRTREE